MTTLRWKSPPTRLLKGKWRVEPNNPLFVATAIGQFALELMSRVYQSSSPL